MVIMDWGRSDERSDIILDHGVEGGYIATQHLIENGHQDIAVITGNRDKEIARTRFEGLKKRYLRRVCLFVKNGFKKAILNLRGV
ncbi:Ribose operon repressor [Mannheimia haemolytica]|uniref:Ribose operon repressor n=1 Tax=Mannheimia haemolytica TaxID=75985 RepID=A0A378MYG4_MANHA|nr:Ribose operon repressor [Mannheimia haemolytica]